MPGLISSVDMKLGFDLGSEASDTDVRMAIRQSALIMCFIRVFHFKGLAQKVHFNFASSEFFTERLREPRVQSSGKLSFDDNCADFSPSRVCTCCIIKTTNLETYSRRANSPSG